MSRTEHRAAVEADLIHSLPGLDDAARAAILTAITRDRYPNLAAYHKAKAEVMRARIEAMPEPVETAPARFNLVDFANGLLARGMKLGRAGK